VFFISGAKVIFIHDDQKYNEMLDRKAITFLTFPGVVLHEMGHYIACIISGVRVLKVKYINREGNGYVKHDSPESFFKSLFICTAPFLFSSLVSVALVMDFKTENRGLWSFIMLWTAFSAGAHCFPSTQDGKNLWENTKKSLKGLNILALAGLPVVLLIYAADRLRSFGFDFIYSAALMYFTYIKF